MAFDTYTLNRNIVIANSICLQRLIYRYEYMSLLSCIHLPT